MPPLRQTTAITRRTLLIVFVISLVLAIALNVANVILINSWEGSVRVHFEQSDIDFANLTPEQTQSVSDTAPLPPRILDTTAYPFIKGSIGDDGAYSVTSIILQTIFHLVIIYCAIWLLLILVRVRA